MIPPLTRSLCRFTGNKPYVNLVDGYSAFTKIAAGASPRPTEKLLHFRLHTEHQTARRDCHGALPLAMTALRAVFGRFVNRPYQITIKSSLEIAEGACTPAMTREDAKRPPVCAVLLPPSDCRPLKRPAAGKSLPQVFSLILSPLQKGLYHGTAHGGVPNTPGIFPRFSG